ncbi:MAG: 6-bladed beta-propeller [Candidatus Kapaibacterium sp.]
MAEGHDRIVQSYMEKVLALRREREQEELREEELEEIALQSGLSREDLDYTRKSFQDYLNRGKGFLQYDNWERASRELEHAVALSPNNSPALVSLATALWNSGVENHENAEKYRAMQYAERALQLDSNNTEAIRLITHMTEHKGELFSASTGRTTSLTHTSPKNIATTSAENATIKRVGLVIVIAMMVVIFGVVIAIFMMNSTPQVESPTPIPSSDSKDISAVEKEEVSFANEVMAFGSKGIGPGKMEDARHIGLDAAGNIYVGEYSSGRVQKFRSDGTFVSQWNINEDTPMRSLAVSRDGTAYVVFGGIIHKYNGETGELLGTIEYGKWKGFDAVATTPDGGLITFWRGLRKSKGERSAQMSDDIIIYDRNEKVVQVIEKGISSVSGTPVINVKVVVNGEGKVYAMDGFSNAVYVFSREGKYINRFGGRGDGPGQFTAPDALAVDGLGRIYVSSSLHVQVFEGDGRYIDAFPVSGVASGMVINDQDEIFIVARERVMQFKLKDR